MMNVVARNIDHRVIGPSLIIASALMSLFVSIPPASAHDLAVHESATALIERYHKGLGGLTDQEEALAAELLIGREGSGYIQSTIHPLRIHWEDEADEQMAQDVLEIVEHSWDVQVGQMGFYPPPPDCGQRGSDDLDVLIQDLAAGLGGYAAFACYREDTPRADAASFVVVSRSLGSNNLQSAVTHEFNHVLQNAVDYWESMTFKENTATWVMDRMYDDENYYFNYLKSYQRHPDWPIHKFSLTNTYQYGECILLHFLSEYYGGDSTDFIVDWWMESTQDEHANEPDYLDILPDLITRYSSGMDDMADTLGEFALWRYACGPRSDGVRFHDGDLWGNGSLVSIDTEVDLGSLPFLGTPVNSPQDFGFSYFVLSGETPEDGIAIEFTGDEAVSWGVEIIQVRADGPRYLRSSMELDRGWGVALLGPEPIEASDQLVLAVVNLSNAAFDPDSNAGDPRSFSLVISEAGGTTNVDLWPSRPIAASGDRLMLDLGLDHTAGLLTADLYIALELSGSFFFYPDFTEVPAALGIELPETLFAEGTLLDLLLPELSDPLALRWHAAVLDGQDLVDYSKARCNLMPARRVD